MAAGTDARRRFSGQCRTRPSLHSGRRGAARRRPRDASGCAGRRASLRGSVPPRCRSPCSPGLPPESQTASPRNVPTFAGRCVRPTMAGSCLPTSGRAPLEQQSRSYIPQEIVVNLSRTAPSWLSRSRSKGSANTRTAPPRLRSRLTSRTNRRMADTLSRVGLGPQPAPSGERSSWNSVRVKCRRISSASSLLSSHRPFDSG